MQSQDYLGIQYNQNINGETTECAAIAVADLWGNILGKPQDPDYTYAAALKVMNLAPNTGGLDPLCAMQSAVVFHTLPASQETFTALTSGELYIANFNNYTAAQQQFAQSTTAPNGIAAFGSYQEIVNWLALNKGGVAIPMSWYPSFMTPNADGTLPQPQGTPSNHVVTCYYEDSRGLQIKPNLGANFGQNGYVYLPEDIFNQAKTAFNYSFAFDPNAYRWLSIASIAIQHPAIIQYALPQL